MCIPDPPLGPQRRSSHLKIPAGPKMAHAALSRRAIDGPNVSKSFAVGRLGGPLIALQTSARRAI